MNPNQIIRIKMTVQEWNNVMALMAEQPFKISAPYINAIQQQCMEAANQPTRVEEDNVVPIAGE
jgi:hypothetical protein